MDGSVLEAVTAGPDGPVGLMIVKGGDETSRRTTLDLGDERLKVSVSEPSASRRMGVHAGRNLCAPEPRVTFVRPDAVRPHERPAPQSACRAASPLPG